MYSDSNKVKGRILLFVACAAGIIQGLVWLFSSIIAVCIYEDVWSITVDVNSFDVSDLIVQWYLTKDVDTYRKIDADDFVIFIYIYMVLSFLWVIISCGLLKETIQNKSHSYTIYIQGVWPAVALSSSVVDIVLMSYLSYDLSKFLDNLPEVPWNSLTHNLFNVFWILIAIAIRGVLFLVLNITVSCLIIKNIIACANDESSGLSHPIINAYDESTMSTFPMSSSKDLNPLARSNWTTNQNSGIDNPSFSNLETEASTHIPRDNSRQHTTHTPETPDSNWTFHSQDSQIPRTKLKQNPTNEPPESHWSFPENYSNRSTSPISRTAKIGNQGRNSPLSQVPIPRVPTPDYTPPNSPRSRLKPVLKSRSSYM